MTSAERAVEKAQKDADNLAKKYSVSRSAVIWLGGERFAVVKNDKVICVEKTMRFEEVDASLY